MSAHPQPPKLPVDPDVPPGGEASPSTARPASTRSARRSAAAEVRGRADVLAVIAVGGALGSGARYGVARWLPHGPAHVPWSTVTVNVVGSLLLGALMVFVLDVWPPNRYLRPFLGVGVLGGFTTFSTYMVDTWSLLRLGQAAQAAGYLLGTLAAGLVAMWVGIMAARTAVALAERRRMWVRKRRIARPPEDEPAARRAAAGPATPNGVRDGIDEHTTRSTP